MANHRMSVKEFRELGYLQELNRRFLHPLGLAIEVIVDDDNGSERFGIVHDHRDDPEGIIFESFTQGDAARSLTISKDLRRRLAHRRKSLGYGIQPIMVI